MIELLLPKDNNTILASRCQLYLPSMEQLQKQIEKIEEMEKTKKIDKK